MKLLKELIRHLLYRIIELVERFEYHAKDFDEDDISKKIIESLDICRYKILTDTGYKPITHIHKTQPYRMYKLVTESGKVLDCADTHIVFNSSMSETFIKDLEVGDEIITKSGTDRIISLSTSNIKVSMCDLSINDNNHRYYTNGILSHNTIMSVFFIMWYLCFNIDKNVLIVANKATTMIEIIDKLKVVYENLPFFLKPGVFENNKQRMTFDNGCRIVGQATTPTPALGFTIHLLYADEFAHVPANIIEPFYRSVYPTLSSSLVSRIIITSTPNGMNKFHQLYSSAWKREEGNQFNPIRVDWWEVPGRDEKWKQHEIANLGSIEDFNQEYGNQFLSSARLLVDYKTLKKMIKLQQDFIFHWLDPLTDKGLDYTNLTWLKSFENFDFNKKRDRFIVSVDIADGVGRDFSVINIFKIVPMSLAKIRTMTKFKDETNFFKLKQVGLFHANNISIDDFSDILSALIFDIFDPEMVKIVLEMNFKGDLVINKLERHKEFFIEMLLHTKHTQSSNYLLPGVKLNSKNKPLMCNELGHILREGRIYISEKTTVEEASAFGLDKKDNYSSQLGHDDIMMTCVNLVPFFESSDYYEFVEEIFDYYKDDIRGAIMKKMGTISEEDKQEMDYKFLKDIFNN